MRKLRTPSLLLFLGIISLTALSFGDAWPSSDNSAASEQSTPGVGEKAPDISMEGPNGQTHKLSDLRGKVVLIDFWASWCRPCRIENPNVVKLYKKYKDQEFKYGDGFTIFSVSLDRSKSNWKKAIEQDNLEWPYHVSDLKMWNNAAAAKYSITSIPATYLIDEDGIILAKNLRGQSLENALEKMAQ